MCVCMCVCVYMYACMCIHFSLLHSSLVFSFPLFCLSSSPLIVPHLPPLFLSIISPLSLHFPLCPCSLYKHFFCIPLGSFHFQSFLPPSLLRSFSSFLLQALLPSSVSSLLYSFQHPCISLFSFHSFLPFTVTASSTLPFPSLSFFHSLQPR